MSNLFELGEIVVTPAAIEFLREHDIDGFALIARHVTGDWGEAVDEEDAAENVFALDKKLRIFSAYIYKGEKIWVITEADRSSTCILLPADY